jgi:hypothetical protein
VCTSARVFGTQPRGKRRSHQRRPLSSLRPVHHCHAPRGPPREDRLWEKALTAVHSSTHAASSSLGDGLQCSSCLRGGPSDHRCSVRSGVWPLSSLHRWVRCRPRVGTSSVFLLSPPVFTKSLELDHKIMLCAWAINAALIGTTDSLRQ